MIRQEFILRNKWKQRLKNWKKAVFTWVPSVHVPSFTGIYPSSLTSVHFWTKIRFSNVVKCRWGSWGAVSYLLGLWWSPGEGSGRFLPDKLRFLTSGEKCFKIKFYEYGIWKLNSKIEFLVPSKGHQNWPDSSLLHYRYFKVLNSHIKLSHSC